MFFIGAGLPDTCVNPPKVTLFEFAFFAFRASSSTAWSNSFLESSNIFVVPGSTTLVSIASFSAF